MRVLCRARTRGWFPFAVLILLSGLMAPGEPAVARAPAGGWQAPTQLSDSGRLADAAMAGAAAVVAWTDEQAVVVGYRLPDGQWETTELGAGTRPRVGVNAAGRAVVVWQQQVAEASTVVSAQRTPEGPWTEPVTVSRGSRAPIAAVNAAGTVRVLAVKWNQRTRTKTHVQLFSYASSWSPPVVLTTRRVTNNFALRRSLTLTTDSAGRAVAGWLCRANTDVRPGFEEGWICLHYRGSRNESTWRQPNGRYAISAPGKRPIYLATPFAITEVRPGDLYLVGWGPWRGVKISEVGLDVHGRGGVMSWQVAGPNEPIWLITRRAGAWRNAIAVARHTHDLSGATYAEPDTSLVFWRTGGERLRTAARTGTSPWRRDTSALGHGVEEAELVSNQSGDAVLAWSSGGDNPGVFVTIRPAG